MNIEYFLHTDELTAEQGWRLLAWCAERGGREFTLQFLSFGDQPSGLHERLKKELAPYYVGKSLRPGLVTQSGESPVRFMDMWHLETESIAALRRHLVDGIFASPSPSATEWFENFTIYRYREIMTGVTSHEGLLNVSLNHQELQHFSDLGIQTLEVV
jgi:hypothetical protein